MLEIGLPPHRMSMSFLQDLSRAVFPLLQEPSCWKQLWVDLDKAPTHSEARKTSFHFFRGKSSCKHTERRLFNGLQIQLQKNWPYAVEKVPFRSQFFRSSNPIRASRRKIDFFNGIHGSDCSIEKVFEAHRISHHPRKHTITPYNSSDAGLTAAAAAAAAAAAHSESA